MKYRAEASSIAGFVQQLASNYLPHGYWFYVAGHVPPNKEPRSIDAKLIKRYGIDISRQSRARRKLDGWANMHYLRYGRRFVLLATHGRHEFFEWERDSIRDARTHPIQIWEYSISVKKGQFLKKRPGSLPTPDGRYRVRVQISRQAYCNLTAYFRDIATKRDEVELARELYCVPFEPYAPVRKQMLRILKKVNEARRAAGRGVLPYSVLRYRRQIVLPFGVAHPLLTSKGEAVPILSDP